MKRFGDPYIVLWCRKTYILVIYSQFRLFPQATCSSEKSTTYSYLLFTNTCGSYRYRHIGTTSEEETRISVHFLHNVPLQQINACRPDHNYHHPRRRKRTTQQFLIQYGILTSLLSDNGPQIVSKFFAELCAFLDTKRKTTMVYHPQTNVQFIRYNKTIKASLIHYFNKHHSYWDSLLQPLTYAYTYKVHRST